MSAVQLDLLLLLCSTETVQGVGFDQPSHNLGRPNQSHSARVKVLFVSLLAGQINRRQCITKITDIDF
jgi:hypothetical protein